MNKLRALSLLAVLLGSPCAPVRAEDAAQALPAPETPLSELVLVAFDTETTGLSPNNDRIVEIGATRFEGGQPGEQQSWLVNPHREIPYYAEKVHGISDDMVADQPPFKEVYPRFAEFAGQNILLAHNANFDVKFMTSELGRNELDPPANQVLDTLKLFRAWFPDAPSHNLGKLALYAGIDTGRLHRAEADATVILHILQKGVDARAGEVTWGDLLRDAGGLKHFGP